MARRYRRIGLIVAVLGAGVLAGTKTPAPGFIPADAVDVIALLPAPPAAETAEVKAELEVVRRAQRDATDAEKARAKSEKKLTMGAFASVAGPWFTAENLPRTAALLKQLEADSKLFTALGKTHFKRLRPSAVNAGISDLVAEDEKEFSYPSGHSTQATLLAAVLGEAMPDLKEKLAARAQEIGWDRIIAGVHYPSDIIAGRVLGQALARGALANPELKKALEGVKAEIDGARAKAASAGAPVR